MLIIKLLGVNKYKCAVPSQVIKKQVGAEWKILYRHSEQVPRRGKRSINNIFKNNCK